MTSRSLTEFELFVLIALAHLGADAYGVTVRREIERRSRRSVSIGAVYTTLARLERRGLIRFTFSAPVPTPGGRSKKHAHLTEAGARALREATATFGRMLDGLPRALTTERG